MPAHTRVFLTLHYLIILLPSFFFFFATLASFIFFLHVLITAHFLTQDGSFRRIATECKMLEKKKRSIEREIQARLEIKTETETRTL